MSIVAYKYGVPSWSDLDQAGIEQLRLAHELRNELVATEREHAEQVAAIWADHPAVADALRAVNEATERIEAVVEGMKRGRQRDRSTIPRVGDKTRLAEARKARKEAKALLREAKDAAMVDMRPRFAEAKQACRACRVRNTAAADSLYKQYVVARGLAWGTFNDVAARWGETAKRVAQARNQGKPADLRFHRFTAEGRITVQVQKDADGARRKVWEVFGEGRHRVLRLSVRARHSAGPVVVELPIVWHRDLPEGADVTEVRVVRRKVGTQHRLSVVFTCRVPDVEPRTVGSTVAVRLSWASAGDGWLRVARVASTAPLGPVPQDVAGIARGSGMAVEVGYSPEWRWLLERDARIRGHRDDLLDGLRAQVVSALGDGEVAQQTGVTAVEVSRWRSPARFVRLARDWPDDHPLVEEMEAWRVRDRHLYDYEAHERDQVIARRRDAYRKVAEWITRDAKQVVLHGLDLAGLRHAPDVAVEDTQQARHGRAQAQQAAPGELRAAIEQAAAKRGVAVVYADESTEEVAA